MIYEIILLVRFTQGMDGNGGLLGWLLMVIMDHSFITY